jgi:hypothetical protein
MTDIYLDAPVLSAPDATDHLGHLIEAGQRVILVGVAAETALAKLPMAVRLDQLPSDPARGSWFVTAEPARCADRPAGVRTVLIGPRSRGSGVRGPRCDTVARDLAAAVLEILAHDAMGS